MTNQDERDQSRRGDEAIRKAGWMLATDYERTARMTPREQAEAAYPPGGPSVDDLEAEIRERRGFQRISARSRNPIERTRRRQRSGPAR